MLPAAFALLLLMLTARTVQGQALLSQTTWGAAGSDVANGVAAAADGSAFVTGITDSFTVDEFGTPSPRIFLVRFAPNGSLDWQRIANAPTFNGGFQGPVVALGASNSVYVTGSTVLNGGDAILLKFDTLGNFLWERTWGGAEADQGNGVATAADGSVYVAGTAANFASFFVLKFDAAGTLLWQKIWDGASGMAIAVAPDGSVYASGASPRPNAIGDFDVIVLKITPAGSLVWARTYSAGFVVDPRGGMTVAPDGSVYIAGAIQAPKMGIVDLAVLLVKMDPSGNLLFDREWGGKSGDAAAGVAAAADGSVYLSGASSSFGAGGDAFVLHILANGKAASAVTWGGTGFDSGGGVAVTGGAVLLAATTTTPPPYSLVSASKKVSGVKGTVAVPAGNLADGVNTAADPGAGATPVAGSTVYGGNFEAALVRITP
jgi:hypothetical protein